MLNYAVGGPIPSGNLATSHQQQIGKNKRDSLQMPILPSNLVEGNSNQVSGRGGAAGNL